MMLIWALILIAIVILACIAVYVAERYNTPNAAAFAVITGLCCACALPLVVLQITKIEEQVQAATQAMTANWRQLQQEAIQYNYARYNPTNGVWEWIKP